LEKIMPLTTGQKACVVTAAANWRSAIELALMGMKKK
jgi:hypothetical protein